MEVDNNTFDIMSRVSEENVNLRELLDELGMTISDFREWGRLTNNSDLVEQMIELEGL